ncbi:prevent-host-death family protein [Quadrisphaera granulorum]|uniref:Antitoxin n=1 Tax=Quadrisphaera granulorum TaxID=317664 RepID=A0A315ZT18_9ACTN|nr:type II toxin-antitoxin system Phd/YefM family antitoxin [Quadrisphaera granulorum]PWJ47874.1 prevent-host-death family protein [Quadrisphaera granulorum]SZE98641.1 prevent-host-death family protein [Quadrisphaera granulorum]
MSGDWLSLSVRVGIGEPVDTGDVDSLMGTISIGELRANLDEVIERAENGDQRIGITRNGTLVAVVISVKDFEALEAVELAQDTAAYRAAKVDDDADRVTLEQLRSELDAE